MKITRIHIFQVKAENQYNIGSDAVGSALLPASSYFRYADLPQLYSRYSEALVVRIDTDVNISGWGEAQAPIAPEIAETVIAKILGPVVLGKDPVNVADRFEEMYNAMRVRGHGTGLYVDAIAAIDTALWDIRARAMDLPLCDALGGRLRSRLPVYASGLRAANRQERGREAIDHAEAGIGGVKLFLGRGIDFDRREIEQIRNAVGDRAKLYVDALWAYDHHEAIRLGRFCEELSVSFLESPMRPDDMDGHVELCATLDVPIAAGETLRTRFQTMPWIQSRALDICQPDVMRNGVSEAYKLGIICDTHNVPIAYHTGCTTVVGLAATLHVAAAAPTFLVQEYQPVMVSVFNNWLEEPITVQNGEFNVPDGPGLGIIINSNSMARDVSRYTQFPDDC
jgi:L-alanine-DL-glutamate epimerase-like enolase superfamily enzyme